jgi:stage II sporulation protein AA (anti-sigma F factor antagonist)
MAKNFQALTKRNKNRFLSIRLSGDFDGSSAFELINILDKNAKKKTKVAIDTDGLRTINAFGLNVFRPHIYQGSDDRPTIEITGRFRNVFQAD